MQWWTLQQLKSKNASTRLAAVEKIGRQGPAVFVETLALCLSDPDERVRASAAEALGQSRKDDAVPPLIQCLLKDGSPEARRAAAKALEETAHPKALPALVEALGDPVGDVGWQAAHALKTLEWSPASESEQAAWHLALGQFDAAVGCGSAAVEPLAKLAHSVAFHRCIRAVEALARVGGAPVVKPLLDALVNKDSTVRSAAANALGQVGDARAVDPLLHALKDGNDQVRLCACVSLSKMGDERAVEPIITLLDHKSPDVRAAAAEALGKLADARAAQPLIARLADPDTEVREHSANSLGFIGETQAIAHLVVSLTDPQSTVRAASAGALRRIEPYWERSEAAHQAIPTLQGALKHKEYWVRHSAAEVLKKLGRSQAEETALLTNTDGARQKRQAARAVLLGLLADRDREFRQAAAEALGRIGAPDSPESLAALLSDSDRGVQFAAARSLENLRWQPAHPADRARHLVALEKWPEAAAVGPDAVPALAAACAWNEPQARRRAIEALVRIGGPSVASALRGLAASRFEETRAEALAALAALEQAAPPPPAPPRPRAAFTPATA